MNKKLLYYYMIDNQLFIYPDGKVAKFEDLGTSILVVEKSSFSDRLEPHTVSLFDFVSWVYSIFKSGLTPHPADVGKAHAADDNR